MTDVKMTLEMVRIQLGLTRQEMADRMMISVDRYNRLANGKSKMLAVEWSTIHSISNIPYEYLAIQ